MKRLLVALLVAITVLLAVAAALIVVRPPFAQPLLALVGVESTSSSQVSEGSSSDRGFSDVGDAGMTDEEIAAAEAERLERMRTPLIAQVDGLDLRTPIAASNLTGVLFHQASNDYALVLSTKLSEADAGKALEKRTIRVNADQQEGEWLDADAIHVWRTDDTTDMDTSIDVGARPGTTVISPVTGTVVLVKDYLLYEEVPDIEIHIQPEGRPDLDCVLIHTTKPLVKAGDKVEAGITEISHVRDIEKDLTDVQLSFYTPEGVGGNHTHVQVNDASSKWYKKHRLKGAVKAES